MTLISLMSHKHKEVTDPAAEVTGLVLAYMEEHNHVGPEPYTCTCMHTCTHTCSCVATYPTTPSLIVSLSLAEYTGEDEDCRSQTPGRVGREGRGQVPLLSLQGTDPLQQDDRIVSVFIIKWRPSTHHARHLFLPSALQRSCSSSCQTSTECFRVCV